MDILQTITDLWGVILVIGTGIGSFLTWLLVGRAQRKKQVVEVKLETSDTLLARIEELTLKVTEALDKQVEDARLNFELKSENIKLVQEVNKLKNQLEHCNGKLSSFTKDTQK